MNSFVEKFKVEVTEYCERLESGLLQLEHDPDNAQVIGEIFRMMHTMKGSGGMFGFDLLSDVTHDLESLFEIFRSKEHTIDSETISFTLNSIDELKKLLVENPGEEHHILAANLKAETQNQIVRFSGKEAVLDNEITVVAKTPEVLNQTTYYISFIPDENILKNGTNPLYLIDELNALGECNIQITTDKLPSLTDIEPSNCYISWYLFIATTESIDTLNDVFIFVSMNAQIEIEKVAEWNVIHQESILADFLNAKSNGEEWHFDAPEKKEKTEKKSLVINDSADDSTVLLKIKPEQYKNSAFDQTTVDSIRVSSSKIDHYMNLVSELIIAQSRLDQVSSVLNNPELTLVAESFGKINRQLRDNAFDMSMIPIQSLVVRFKRLIHDLSKSLDKEVNFVTEGMETELDKNIIEKLIEPLLHIIRNSLDHGIESKTERLSKNKEAVGTILLKASTVGSYVKIEIEDDGGGLNVDRIREKAIARGLISESESQDDEQIYQLIFEPGFSTANVVTDVSGRGVGMDVVQRSVMAMRGSIEVSSEKDKFARFTIKLPLSLSIIDGLLVLIGSNYYVIPTNHVQKLHLFKSAQFNFDQKTIWVDDQELPLINLPKEFANSTESSEDIFLVVVSTGNQHFGLMVTEVVREFQAVVKPLGQIMKTYEMFSGASILGTGQLALVIDTDKLIQKYSR